MLSPPLRTGQGSRFNFGQRLRRRANDDSPLSIAHCQDQGMIELNRMLFPVNGDHEIRGRGHRLSGSRAIRRQDHFIRFGSLARSGE